MNRHVTHPSKEQVRAYMLAREHAHQPPPPPEQIRRQLGWHVVSASGEEFAFATLCLLPATLGQITLQALLECCLAPLRAGIRVQVAKQH